MSVIPYLNPFARDGEGAKLNEGIIRDLQRQYGPEEVHVENRPIPDAYKRAEAWHEIIKRLDPSILFPSGGDGTYIDVAQAALGGNIITLDQMRSARLNPGLIISGIGTGSAQDIKAVLGFPGPKDLRDFLENPQNQETFELGAVWMIREDNKGNPLEIRLANHSVSWGFISYIFERRERFYQEWKQDPKNEGKPVPVYLNTIVGRALQAPVVAFKKGREYIRGFRGQSVTVTMPDGSQKLFQNTAITGVFSVPMMANFFAMPRVNPIAGNDFGALVMVLPYNLTLIPLMAEGVARGLLAKYAGLKSLAGPHVKYWSLGFLNRFASKLGWWDPERIFTLKHGERVTIEVDDLDIMGLRSTPKIKKHKNQTIFNGDLIKPMRRATIEAGPRDQIIRAQGRKDSVMGNISGKQRQKQAPNLMQGPQSSPNGLQRTMTESLGAGGMVQNGMGFLMNSMQTFLPRASLAFC